MAAISKYGTPNPVSKLPEGHNRVGSGYLVGEDIAAGDACALVPNTTAIAAGVPTMQIMRADGTGGDLPGAIVVGFAPIAAKVAQADALTLLRDIDWTYGNGMIASFLTPAVGPVYVYLSATVKGGLDTVAPWPGAQPVGVILDDTRIRLWGNVGAADTAVAEGGVITKVVAVPLAAVATAGGAFSWANPEATPIMVKRVIVDVRTVSAGAATLDIGTTAATATTLSDNLLDGIDVHTATGVFDNMLAANAGTNGLTALKLAVGKWVTGSSVAAAALTGLVGTAYITYDVLAV